MARLSKFLRLSRLEKADFVRALFELALARLRIVVLEPSSLYKMRLKGDSDTSSIVDRISVAIPRAASVTPWRCDCLIQALAARRWLMRAGVRCSLVVGVRRDAKRLDSHAWVEVGNRVVVGDRQALYVPIGSKS